MPPSSMLLSPAIISLLGIIQLARGEFTFLHVCFIHLDMWLLQTRERTIGPETMKVVGISCMCEMTNKAQPITRGQLYYGSSR